MKERADYIIELQAKAKKELSKGKSNAYDEIRDEMYMELLKYFFENEENVSNKINEKVKEMLK